MTSMLRNVIDNGTGTKAQIDRPAAGKTSDQRPARRLVHRLHAAAADRRLGRLRPGQVARRKETGGKAAAPIWHDFMVKALANEQCSTSRYRTRSRWSRSTPPGNRTTPGTAGSVSRRSSAAPSRPSRWLRPRRTVRRAGPEESARSAPAPAAPFRGRGRSAACGPTRPAAAPARRSSHVMPGRHHRRYGAPAGGRRRDRERRRRAATAAATFLPTSRAAAGGYTERMRTAIVVDPAFATTTPATDIPNGPERSCRSSARRTTGRAHHSSRCR